jgi:hypothetical protein
MAGASLVIPLHVIFSHNDGANRGGMLVHHLGAGGGAGSSSQGSGCVILEQATRSGQASAYMVGWCAWLKAKHLASSD